MAIDLPPLPKDAIIPDIKALLKSGIAAFMPRAWVKWLQTVAAVVNSAPRVYGSVSISAGDANVAETPIPVGREYRVSGPYRLSWVLRISRASTATSSVQVLYRWTVDGVAQFHAGTAVTGNTTTSLDQGVYVLVADADTDIIYEVAYGSTGAVAAQYELEIRLEALAKEAS